MSNYNVDVFISQLRGHEKSEKVFSRSTSIEQVSKVPSSVIN